MFDVNRGIFLPVLLSGALCFSGVALAANPSGTVVRADQNAKATGSEGARVLLTQGAVFMGDQITTDAHGVAQIIFVDNTRFVIGPNSKTTIDKFVFNADNTARTVTITATKGVFRFISGISPHRAYTIRTPAMIIGVRGTALDFGVEAGTGKVTQAILSGSTNNCAGGVCVVNEATCGIVIALPGGSITQANEAERAQALATSLPFIGPLGETLLPALQVPTTGCEHSANFAPPIEPPHNDDGKPIEEKPAGTTEPPPVESSPTGPSL